MKILTVTDLHQRAKLYAELKYAVASFKPDVVAAVGDFLDATKDTKGKISVEECAATFARLKCREIVFVPGNHEGMALWAFREAFLSSQRSFHCLEGEAIVIDQVAIVGFPCFLGGSDGIFREVPSKVDQWLPPIIEQHGAAARLLWLMHEPPASKLQWYEAMTRYIPKAVVHGHDHEGPIQSRRWHRRVGETAVMNVGQNLNSLRFIAHDVTDVVKSRIFY